MNRLIVFSFSLFSLTFAGCKFAKESAKTPVIQTAGEQRPAPTIFELASTNDSAKLQAAIEDARAKSANFDVDMIDERGRTALAIAVMDNRAGNVQVLLNFGASPAKPLKIGDEWTFARVLAKKNPEIEFLLLKKITSQREEVKKLLFESSDNVDEVINLLKKTYLIGYSSIEDLTSEVSQKIISQDNLSKIQEEYILYFLDRQTRVPGMTLADVVGLLTKSQNLEGLKTAYTKYSFTNYHGTYQDLTKSIIRSPNLSFLGANLNFFLKHNPDYVGLLKYNTELGQHLQRHIRNTKDLNRIQDLVNTLRPYANQLYNSMYWRADNIISKSIELYLEINDPSQVIQARKSVLDIIDFTTKTSNTSGFCRSCILRLARLYRKVQQRDQAIVEALLKSNENATPNMLAMTAKELTLGDLEDLLSMLPTQARSKQVGAYIPVLNQFPNYSDRIYALRLLRKGGVVLDYPELRALVPPILEARWAKNDPLAIEYSQAFFEVPLLTKYAFNRADFERWAVRERIFLGTTPVPVDHRVLNYIQSLQ